MMRILLRSSSLLRLSLAVVALVTMVSAQQPNSSRASLSINGISGPSYPLDVSSARGGLVTLRIEGEASGSALPFILAMARVEAGSATLGGVGSLDLDLTTCGWTPLLDGFQAAHPLNGLSFLPAGATPTFQASFGYLATSTLMPGLQALVASPSASAGATLSAAADFFADGPSIASVSPTSGPAGGGIVVRLNGDGFACDPATVLVNGELASAVTAIDGQTLEFVLPPQASGSSSQAVIEVIQLNGTAQLSGAFSYQPGNPVVIIDESFSSTAQRDATFAPEFNHALWNDNGSGVLSGLPLSGTPLANSTAPAGSTLGTRSQYTVEPPAQSQWGLYAPFDDSSLNIGINPNGGSHIMHLYEAIELGNTRDSLELVEWGPLNDTVIASSYPQYRAWCGQTTRQAPLLNASPSISGLSGIYTVNYDQPTRQAHDPLRQNPGLSDRGGVLVSPSSTYTTQATFQHFYPFPVFQNPFDFKGSGPGSGNLVLEMDIAPGSQVANFNRFRATSFAPVRRLIGASLLDGGASPFASGYDIYQMRFTFVSLEASAQSRFLDTGFSSPIFQSFDISPAPTAQPAGTEATWEVQGATALTPGGAPSGTVSPWMTLWDGTPAAGSFDPLVLHNPGNPAAPQLSGYRYLRYRVRMRGNHLSNQIQSYDSLQIQATY